MLLADIFECVAKHLRPAPKVRWKIGPFSNATSVGTTAKVHCYCKRNADMALILKDTQKFSAAVKYVDGKGNPAKVEGTPQWSVSDVNLLGVTPSDDGMSAEVVATGPLGSCQVSVTADADLGEGTKPIIGTLDVDIVAGEAVSAVIEAGAPAEQA